MRNDPPSGEELDDLVARMTATVLGRAETRPEPLSELPAGSPSGLPAELPAARAVPRSRFRLGALIVAGLLVLGVGTAGGALALGFGPRLFPGAAPTPSTTASATAAPTPTSTPTTTVDPAPPPPAPGAPSVSVPTATFTAPSWGDGLTAEVSGLTSDTEYAVSTDTRYRGESKTPDGFFSIFSSPVAFTTDASGAASVTWTPDAFPLNFTDSLESGYSLGTQVRVDPAGGPVRTASGTADVDPLALSDPLSIGYLPTTLVSISTQSCIAAEDLVDTAAGLPVQVTGLLPGEFIVLSSQQTGGPTSFDFRGYGYADPTGSALVVMHGSAVQYPVSSSSEIAPGSWQIVFGGSYRATPGTAPELAPLPLQIGDCS